MGLFLISFSWESQDTSFHTQPVISFCLSNCPLKDSAYLAVFTPPYPLKEKPFSFDFEMVADFWDVNFLPNALVFPPNKVSFYLSLSGFWQYLGSNHLGNSPIPPPFFFCCSLFPLMYNLLASSWQKYPAMFSHTSRSLGPQWMNLNH